MDVAGPVAGAVNVAILSVCIACCRSQISDSFALTLERQNVPFYLYLNSEIR